LTSIQPCSQYSWVFSYLHHFLMLQRELTHSSFTEGQVLSSFMPLDGLRYSDFKYHLDKQQVYPASLWSHWLYLPKTSPSWGPCSELIACWSCVKSLCFSFHFVLVSHYAFDFG
jgi:hypothetical protein